MSDAFNLLDETFTTVGVVFYNNEDDEFRTRGKRYHYKVPRLWDVKVDDMLAVFANQKPTIVKVAVVHEEPDFNGLHTLQYAIQKIDMSMHDALRAREETFRNAMRVVERQRQKDELIDTLSKQAGGSEKAKELLAEALGMIGARPRLDAAADVPAPVADAAQPLT
jgi:nucleoside-triphosphatase THEP1